jgi:putative DNA primase/helicase
MMLHGAWVAEMPELDSLSRTEETRLKAFITLKEDTYIPKYSNFRITTPRRTIFVGTTNEESYLKGQTGNTRFLPIKITHVVAVDDFLVMREQLLAEALVYYKQHLQDWWMFPEDALPEAKAMRDARRIVNVFEEPLREWLSTGRFFDTLLDDGKPHVPIAGETTWREIARWFLKMESPERWKDVPLQKQIAAALRALGWEQLVEWCEDDTGTKKSRRIWRDTAREVPP